MLEGYRSVLIIDHHKSVSEQLVLNQETGEITRERVRGERAEVRRRLEGLPRPAVVYLEACRSWEWVSDLCDGLGIECRLIDPGKMPEIARSKKKTDRHDVDAMLSRLLAVGKLPESHRATRVERELRELTRNRMDVQRLVRQTLNRLHALCDGQGLPARQRDFTDLEWRGRMSAELGPQLGLVLEVLLDQLAHLRGAIERLEGRLVELTAERADVRALKTIPGIGPILAATMVAEIGDISRFKDSRHLASFSGLVTAVRSSAGKARMGHISKAGPPALRWALTQAIISGLRVRGNPFARYYRRKRPRGRGAMLAVCAAAHKLARVIFVVLSRQVAFDPVKVGRAA